MVLTSNTQANKKSRFFNYLCTVLFGLRKKSNKKQVTLLKIFLCDILSNGCNTQYFHTTEHTYGKIYGQ